MYLKPLQKFHTVYRLPLDGSNHRADKETIAATRFPNLSEIKNVVWDLGSETAPEQLQWLFLIGYDQKILLAEPLAELDAALETTHYDPDKPLEYTALAVELLIPMLRKLKSLSAHILFVTRMKELFGVNSGQFYRTFLEIRNRKSDRTTFLSLLVAQLLKRMEEADD